jgi:hypothetical protein
MNQQRPDSIVVENLIYVKGLCLHNLQKKCGADASDEKLLSHGVNPFRRKTGRTTRNLPAPPENCCNLNKILINVDFKYRRRVSVKCKREITDTYFPA